MKISDAPWYKGRGWYVLQITGDGSVKGLALLYDHEIYGGVDTTTGQKIVLDAEIFEGRKSKPERLNGPIYDAWGPFKEADLVKLVLENLVPAVPAVSGQNG